MHAWKRWITAVAVTLMLAIAPAAADISTPLYVAVTVAYAEASEDNLVHTKETVDALVALRELYHMDLTAQELFVMDTWIENVRQLRHQDEWEVLERAVHACRSPADVSAMLSMAFVGLNSAPEGQPQPADFAEQAREVLDAAGYEAFTLFSPLYNRVFEPKVPIALFLAGTEEVPGEDEYWNTVSISMHENGRISSLTYRAGSLMEGMATDEQLDFATEAAYAFAIAYADIGEPDVSEVKVVRNTYVNYEVPEDPVLRVWVYYTTQEPTEDFQPEGAQARIGCMMRVGVASGRIYDLYTYISEAAFDRLGYNHDADQPPDVEVLTWKVPEK